MQTALSIAVGLIWGLAVAFVNSRVTKHFMAKGTNAAVMAINLVHMLVDVAAIALVFLLRNILPLRYEYILIGTAATLGLGTVFFAYRLARPVNTK